MFGSGILDVAIGLVFIYVVFSLVHTALNEYVSGLFAMRSKNLRVAIDRMFGDAKSKEFYEHPIIQTLTLPFNAETNSKKIWKRFVPALFGRDNRGPAYIEAADFARVAISLIRKKEDCKTILASQSTKSLAKTIENAASVEAAQKTLGNFLGSLPKEVGESQAGMLQGLSDNSIRISTVESMSKQLQTTAAEMEAKELLDGAIKLGNTPFGKVVRNSLNSVGAEISNLEKDIEKWFDNSMKQAHGWYQQKIRYVSLLLAFIVACCFNVNSINICKELYRDPALRASIVAAAEKAEGEELSKLQEQIENRRRAKQVGVSGWLGSRAH